MNTQDFMLDKSNRILDLMSMHLDTYLRERNITNEAFGETLGCTGEAVRQWRLGNQIPRRASMDLITRVTNGEVSPSDFYGLTAKPGPIDRETREAV